jgi:hypothetical protein
MLFSFVSIQAHSTDNGVTEIESAKEVKAHKGPHVRAGQAKALLAIEQEKYQVGGFKTVIVDVKLLTDNQGQTYLAGLINKSDVDEYLVKMQQMLNDEFELYRQHQSARDHGVFHVTLVNPNEFQTLSKNEMLLNQKLRIQFHGLGRVSQGGNSAYYVVASSMDGDFIRQKLLLNKKDFHVTLGFKSQDVYGVSKGQETLIK